MRTATATVIAKVLSGGRQRGVMLANVTQVRQRGSIRRDAPRLVARHELGGLLRQLVDGDHPDLACLTEGMRRIA
jgi:hypothetical protein